MNNVPSRPALRYYGGKWKLAPWVISKFPKHRTYVEPFGGAASVLLRKPPSRVEVYNDLSDEVVNLFRVLRDKDQAKELRRLLDLTPWSRSEWLAAYELSDSPIEQARRTIVLGAQSHNASKALSRKTNGWRSSSTGDHKMPQDFKNYTEALQTVTLRMKDVLIENRDAKKVMAQHDSFETLHYVDPPYIGSTRSDSRNTYQHELQTDEDHKALSDFLHKLKGYVILSGYKCDNYRKWYTDRGWLPTGKEAVTGAAKKGHSKKTEVVWLNPRAAAAQRQLKIF
jgi:DNA adenine methylase